MVHWVKNHTKIILTVLLGLIGVSLFLYLFYQYSLADNDWSHFYSKLASHLHNPMEVPGYINPPWAALLVLFGLFPLRLSNAINFLINVIVLFLLIKKVNGGWLGIILCFTSPFFWDLARVNPIDWIPVLGFILPTAWGLPLMAAKPQTLGAAAIVKWKNEKFKLTTLIPLGIVVAASFLIWGNWLPQGTNLLINKDWNFSFWPISIPLGIYVFYHAYKNSDEILAGAATPLLVPYIAPYSLACLIGLLSGKHKKLAITIYIVSVWYFFVEYRRLFL